MRKIITLILTLLMIFTLVGCNSNKNESTVVEESEQQEVVEEPAKEEETIAGGFVEVEDGTLTDELIELFNKALEGLLGAKYEPVELVATQVVAGTNYKFLANGTKTTNPITKGTYYITVYKDLEGNVELLDIETIEEKQEESSDNNTVNNTEDVTKMAFWVVFYDEYDNELQREALMYGSTPKYKGYLPEGFVKWTYKKTGNDVNTFVPITTNTYFKAVCNHVPTPSNLTPEPTPTPEPACENTSTYLIRITSSEGSGSYKYDVYKFNSSNNSYIRTESEKSDNFNPGYSLSLGNYYHSEVTSGFDDLGKLTLCEHVNTHTLKLSETYTITFNMNGHGTNISPLNNVAYGATISKPTDPSEIGYEFDGWFMDTEFSTAWDFDNDIVIENTTLNARWTPKRYTITYKDNGNNDFSGTHDEGYPTIHVYGTETVLKSASKDLYSFVGWFINSDCSGDPISSIEPESYTQDITLYAKWEQACLAKGTLITMADGSKELIENINRGDLVRVFDHDAGKVSSAKVMDYWQYEEKKSGLITLHFTNDIDVNIVTAHGFFNKEENRYVVLNAGNIDSYIGKHFYNVDNDSWETLLGATYSDEKVDTFFIATEGQLVTVAEGMLNIEDGLYTVLRNIYEFDENLMVDETKKAKDIQRYGLYENSDFEYLTKEAFEEYGAANLKVALGKGMITEDFLDEIREEALSYESDNIVEEYIPENIQHSVR